MTVEAETDRATLLADFGQTVVFSPGDTYPSRNNNTASIKGIFDNGYFGVAGEEAAIATQIPTILCRSSDVTDAERNSMVEIGSDVYKVVSIQPDGTGMTVLMLEGPRET